MEQDKENQPQEVFASLRRLRLKHTQLPSKRILNSCSTVSEESEETEDSSCKGRNIVALKGNGCFENRRPLTRRFIQQSLEERENISKGPSRIYTARIFKSTEKSKDSIDQHSQSRKKLLHRRSCLPRFSDAESPVSVDTGNNSNQRKERRALLFQQNCVTTGEQGLDNKEPVVSTLTRRPVQQNLEDRENICKEPSRTDTARISKSTEKPKDSIDQYSQFRKKFLQRRSCLPRFSDAESPVSVDTGNKISNQRKERRAVLFQENCVTTGEQGLGNKEPVVSTQGHKYISFRERRRSRILGQDDVQQTAENENERRSRFLSRNGNERERNILDEEKKTNSPSSPLVRPRVKMNWNLQETGSESPAKSSGDLITQPRDPASIERGKSFFESLKERGLLLKFKRSSEKPAITPRPGRHTPIRQVKESAGRSQCRGSLFKSRLPSRSGVSRGHLWRDAQNASAKRREDAQGYCRMLQFDSHDEGDVSEDHTEPLAMMVQTPIISRVSVLQDPVNEKQKKTSEPVIKKSLIDQPLKVSRFRRCSILVNQQLGNNSPSEENKHKSVKFETCNTDKCENLSPYKVIDNLREKAGNTALSSNFLGGNISNMKGIKPEKASNVETSRSSDFERKVRFPAHSGSTKKNIRRRSAAVLCVRTPVTMSKSKIPHPRSTTKIPKPLSSQQKSQLKRTQKHHKPRRSWIPSSQSSWEHHNKSRSFVRSSQSAQEHHNKHKGLVPSSQSSWEHHNKSRSFVLSSQSAQEHHNKHKGLVPSSQSSQEHQTDQEDKAVSHCYDEEKDKEKNGKNCKLQKTDASTNTMINVTKIQPNDMTVLEDIESLLKEQDEINTKMQLILEKTRARHREMKESGLMESFMISFSPLKRLQAMLQEDRMDENKAEDTLIEDKLDETEIYCGDAASPSVSCTSPGQTVLEHDSPSSSPSSCDSVTHWTNIRQHDRLIQTPLSNTAERPVSQGSSEKYEEFVEADDGSRSPFTKMVGNCERPSIAPMTPHSRQHISLLKTSLKKQLEALYDA